MKLDLKSITYYDINHLEPILIKFIIIF